MNKAGIYFAKLNKAVIWFNEENRYFRIWLFVDECEGLVAFSLDIESLEGLLKESFERATYQGETDLKLKSNFKTFFPNLFLLEYNEKGQVILLDYMKPEDAYKYMQENNQFVNEKHKGVIL